MKGTRPQIFFEVARSCTAFWVSYNDAALSTKTRSGFGSWNLPMLEDSGGLPLCCCLRQCTALSPRQVCARGLRPQAGKGRAGTVKTQGRITKLWVGKQLDTILWTFQL